MSTVKTLVTAALVGAAAFFVAWQVKPEESRERAGDALEKRGVATADYEELQERFRRNEAELATARREIDRLRTALAAEETATQPETPAPQPEPAPAGPHFRFAGVEGLDKLDWDKMGDAMSKMPPVLAALVEGLRAGKSQEELGDLIGKIQQLNGPLLAEALKLSQTKLGGVGVNGSFTHPAVMVNMVHAALEKAGRPLSEEQERALREIGERYVAREKARQAGYGEDAYALDKLVEETRLKDEFFGEVFGLLGDDQAQRLRPDAIRGLTRFDLFDSALVYSQVARPLPFRDRDSLASGAAARVASRLQIDPAQKAAVDAVVQRWVQDMPDAFLDVSQGGPAMERAHVAEAARRQAALFKELARTVPLTPEQLQSLREEGNVLVPFRSR